MPRDDVASEKLIENNCAAHHLPNAHTINLLKKWPEHKADEIIRGLLSMPL